MLVTDAVAWVVARVVSRPPDEGSDIRLAQRGMCTVVHTEGDLGLNVTLGDTLLLMSVIFHLMKLNLRLQR